MSINETLRDIRAAQDAHGNQLATLTERVPEKLKEDIQHLKDKAHCAPCNEFKDRGKKMWLLLVVALAPVAAYVVERLVP